MKQDTLAQYGHFWDVFDRVVGGFSGADWRNRGQGMTRPDSLAYHILKSTRYYVKGGETPPFESGRSFDLEEGEMLPSREEILSLTGYFRRLCCGWLESMDFTGENRDFPWTGKTQYGTVLFLLLHGSYHLGELEGILNECRGGEAPDFWGDALSHPSGEGATGG